MLAKDIIKELEKWVKPSLIDSWDNTGFQVGNENKKINKILLALDLDRKVVDTAINGSYDMIISHHPVLFKGITEITSKDYKGQLLMDLIKHDLVAYNAHSNLDLAENGVNDILAEKLKLENYQKLNVVHSDDYNDYGYGRVGNVKEMPLESYIDIVKTNLETDYVLVYGNTSEKISKVAVCGGSGSGFIGDAYRNGAEVYVTGDIKYHDAQLGCELGMVIIDAGHYDTEKIILPTIKDYIIKNINKDLEVDILWESSIPKRVY